MFGRDSNQQGLADASRIAAPCLVSGVNVMPPYSRAHPREGRGRGSLRQAGATTRTTNLSSHSTHRTLPHSFCFGFVFLMTAVHISQEYHCSFCDSYFVTRKHPSRERKKHAKQHGFGPNDFTFTKVPRCTTSTNVHYTRHTSHSTTHVQNLCPQYQSYAHVHIRSPQHVCLSV